jgi:SAM-dependent methyltransferase
MLLLEQAAADSARRPVLDLACGAGHATFLMRLLFPSLQVISADCDFVNVYLTRRYMAPDGLQLCIDAQAPSPFPDAYFSAVYCQDAFHYFRSKRFVVHELKRVLQPNALWIFPHLHNRLCDNVVAGVPLTPDGYLECFDLTDGKLFAEGDLMRGLTYERIADFGLSTSLSALSKSANLTFIRGAPEVWRPYRCFPEILCRRPDSLRINPIYRIQRQEHHLRLFLHWPNPFIKKECAEAEIVLPHTYSLTVGQLKKVQNKLATSDFEWHKQLVAKFVLVPLPRAYTRDADCESSIH